MGEQQPLNPTDILSQNAKSLGARIDRKPATGIVITGYAMLTPYGNAQETWDGLLNGDPASQEYSGPVPDVHLIAPVKFDASQHFNRNELKRMSHVEAMSRYVAGEAIQMAGLGEMIAAEKPKDKPVLQLLPGISPEGIGSIMSSGIGSSPNILELDAQIWKGLDPEEYMSSNITPERKAEIDLILKKNIDRTLPTQAFSIFPEEMNAGVTISLKNQGWGLTTAEACATGLSSVAEGARLIHGGFVDVAVVGGVEDMFTDLSSQGELLDLTSFSRLRTITGSADPHHATRPFDRDRDGFVPSAGAAALILESEQHARKREAKILARIGGYSKRMDGESRFEMNPKNVARTMSEALYNPFTNKMQAPDVLWAHATATHLGDRREAYAAHYALGPVLQQVDIAAVKSGLGHGRGVAGGWNAVLATMGAEKGQIPHIHGLENPKLQVKPETDPQFTDEIDSVIESRLNPIMGKPLERDVEVGLVTGIGFGGHNVAITVLNA